MPIVDFHLVEDQYTEQQCETLLKKSSELYAAVLNSPIERVRVFIHWHKPGSVAVAGVPINQGGSAAPYFYCLVLEGRPVQQKHQLLTGFTDLLEDILQVERSLIRGACWPIPPEDWCIGGVPASELRAAEIKARAQAAS